MPDLKPKKASLATGFGAAYQVDVEALSLDKLVNQVPAATFYMRVSGDNEGANLANGDIAVVDRSRSPVSNNIVVTIIDSELVIRRYIEKANLIELYRDSELPSETMPKDDFELWGVVTYSLKSHL